MSDLMNSCGEVATNTWTLLSDLASVTVSNAHSGFNWAVENGSYYGAKVMEFARQFFDAITNWAAENPDSFKVGAIGALGAGTVVAFATYFFCPRQADPNPNPA